MISSLVCGSPMIISLTSSGTGMMRRRGKVAPMAVRVASCNSWFLAARLVINIPGGGEGGWRRGGGWRIRRKKHREDGKEVRGEEEG